MVIKLALYNHCQLNIHRFSLLQILPRANELLINSFIDYNLRIVLLSSGILEDNFIIVKMPRKLSEFFGILIILVVIFGNLCDGFNKKKGSIDLRKLKDRFHLHQNLLASPTKVNSKERHNKSYKDDELGLLESVWGRKDDSSLMGDDDDGDAAEVITTSYGPPPSIRLPREVTPIHYFLEIIPLLDNETETIGKIWTAPGNVRILVEAAKPERKITLHALGLNISDVQVSNSNATFLIMSISNNSQ